MFKSCLTGISETKLGQMFIDNDICPSFLYSIPFFMFGCFFMLYCRHYKVKGVR